MEAVEVEAHWDSRGAVEPLRFTWRGQQYAVTVTGRRWKDAAGAHVLCMLPDGRVVELLYQAEQERWWLGFHTPDVKQT